MTDDAPVHGLRDRRQWRAMRTQNWVDANHRYMETLLAELQAALAQRLVSDNWPQIDESERDSFRSQTLAEAMVPPPAIDLLTKSFGLTAFERRIVLLCAGVELDSNFADVCAKVQGNVPKAHPTFGLALAMFSDAHWSALGPAGPLRRWRLVQLRDGGSLTQVPLHIDERILNYLIGVDHLDERLVPYAREVDPPDSRLTSYQDKIAERIASLWTRSVDEENLPIVELCGDDIASKRSVAARTCDVLSLDLWSIPAEFVPPSPSELKEFALLWEREVRLSPKALFIDYDELEGVDPQRLDGIRWLVQTLRCPLFVSRSDPLRVQHRSVVVYDIRTPTFAERRAMWDELLSEIPNRNKLSELLASSFSLSPQATQAACVDALSQVASSPEQEHNPDALPRALWDACRAQARPGLENLAVRIMPKAAWEDIVLPAPLLEILHGIVAQVRHRAKVYHTWGFADKVSRGLGITVLFAGPSGTGKTLASEILAHELGLDLYVIDLSSVLSKYIGDTEKNIRRIFDAAEQGGAVLCFDEADALFGKRSEVKDSHDRYANIEVSYLLQRMEAYRGLAILTTNMKEAIDSAFMRRLRFVVTFPFPDERLRAEIWRRVFPPQAPALKLEVENLARFNVAGGSIRNIALGAAFLAADAKEPIQMTHVLRAARSEYAKLEKPLTESEIRVQT